MIAFVRGRSNAAKGQAETCEISVDEADEHVKTSGVRRLYGLNRR
jgi:hypothetical protein